MRLSLSTARHIRYCLGLGFLGMLSTIPAFHVQGLGGVMIIGAHVVPGGGDVSLYQPKHPTALDAH